MNPRKRIHDLSVGQLDLVDSQTLKAKLQILDSSLQKAEFENKRLQLELERSKFEATKKINEAESKSTSRETELRRVSSKYRVLEKEIKNIKDNLNEQKLRTSELKNNYEQVISQICEENTLLLEWTSNLTVSIINSLYKIGFFNQRKNTVHIFIISEKRFDN